MMISQGGPSFNTSSSSQIARPKQAALTPGPEGEDALFRAAEDLALLRQKTQKGGIALARSTSGSSSTASTATTGEVPTRLPKSVSAAASSSSLSSSSSSSRPPLPPNKRKRDLSDASSRPKSSPHIEGQAVQGVGSGESEERRPLNFSPILSSSHPTGGKPPAGPSANAAKKSNISSGTGAPVFSLRSASPNSISIASALSLLSTGPCSSFVTVSSEESQTSIDLANGCLTRKHSVDTTSEEDMMEDSFDEGSRSGSRQIADLAISSGNEDGLSDTSSEAPHHSSWVSVAIAP